jgi:S-DNA-T family DNA segregation ATPase FtsK/SpoIIIE
VDFMLGDSRPQLRRELAGIALMALGVLALLALYSTAVGPVGQFFDRVLHHLLGRAAPVIPIVVILLGIVSIAGGQAVETAPRSLGLLLFILLLPSLAHLSIPAEQLFAEAQLQQGGGLLGAAVCWALGRAFGPLGRGVILSAVGLAAGVLLTGRTLGDLGELLGKAGRVLWGFVRRTAKGVYMFISEPVEEQGELVIRGLDDEGNEDDEDEQTEEQLLQSLGPAEGNPQPTAVENNGKALPSGAPAKEAAEEQAEEFEQLSIEMKEPYEFPKLELLRKSAPRGGFNTRRRVREQSQQLEETLQSFGVEAKVKEVSQGPAITRYELEPAPGIKVSKVTNLADDLALSLAASDVRVVAPIPGKSLIGIEVPNKDVTPVRLRSVLEEPAFQRSTSQLAVGLGQEISGSAVITTLDKLVHLLIAGATGSGKSVCINTMICSLLYKARPDQVKLVLVDPKVVELTSYNGIPHLLSPVITDPKKAAGVLQWLVSEMEDRYEKFGEAGVRNIDRYNKQLMGNADEEAERLPYIVLIIDELADLMAVAPVDVEDAIQRLAQMARAAGIHLIIATQRPSVDVITGVIKANIPSRIAFAVSSQTDSRVILDTGGAEKLIGKGDMLFMPVGATKPLRVQGSFITEKEIKQLIEHVTEQAEPSYEEKIVEEAEEAASPYADFEDELFPDAVRCVVESGRASVSMLQRRFRIGYTRAGRLIDTMEQEGYVGPHQGSKSRDVLLTMEQYRQVFDDEQ